MHDTASRAQPSEGRWKTATIPLPSSIGPDACLEFVLKNSTGQVHLQSQQSVNQSWQRTAKLLKDVSSSYSM